MTTRDSRNSRQVQRKAIPLEKANLDNNTAKTSGTDFLAADLTPSDTPCRFRIQVSLSAAAHFKVEIKDGTADKVVVFNSGAVLQADVLYVFDHMMHDGDTCNYQADQNVTVNVFRVQEILWGN